MLQLEAKVIMDPAFPDDYSAFVVLDSIDVHEILAALKYIKYFGTEDVAFTGFAPNDIVERNLIEILERIESTK